MKNRDARPLALNRETVREMTSTEMGHAAGGITPPHTGAWPTDFCTVYVKVVLSVVLHNC
ncbi:MAG TPA: hypothetical protein VG245_10390 [Candidatus Dormibacteraeota bacterium]|jgi:hypothetical protein|nr:hypothetical protein [Candidatus Dormibacteraeota bacterium]